jgi:alpha-beta hydrolase superfamily lysophospholipase
MVVDCLEQTLNIKDESIHIYRWTQPAVAPRRIVMLIHGLMMHGKAFDHVASHLASNGSVVVAPDLRGFGRWYFRGSADEKNRIDYRKSVEDLSNLLLAIKQEYSGLPFFCAGESLGTHLARHIAAIQSRKVDGLILSSPCMRPKMVSVPLLPHTLTQLVLTGLDPKSEFDLSPFAEQFLKEEKESLQSYLNDPMTRKSLEFLELVDSLGIARAVKPKRVSPRIPILVLRGRKDCVCETESMAQFIDELKTNNLTIHPCTTCGHLILQNPDVDKAILHRISSWLESHTLSPTN